LTPCGKKPKKIVSNGAVSLFQTVSPFVTNAHSRPLDLGKTRTFVDCFDENDGLTYIWLSYWKDLKGLQEFSNSAPHRLGMKTYNAGKFPYFGIMHETFYAKKDSFETIYDNFPPFGMGKWTLLASRLIIREITDIKKSQGRPASSRRRPLMVSSCKARCSLQQDQEWVQCLNEWVRSIEAISIREFKDSLRRME
jgi:hypothetical protein